MCFHMCVFMQWLVFRCGNTPGPLNEIPAVEESRVQVACGVPASLSLSLLSSPSSPSSVHYSCNQLHYPCGLVSNAHSVLSLSLFAPPAVTSSHKLFYDSLLFLFSLHLLRPLFSLSIFHFLALQVFLFLSVSPRHPHQTSVSLFFSLSAALICHSIMCDMQGEV